MALQLPYGIEKCSSDTHLGISCTAFCPCKHIVWKKVILDITFDQITSLKENMLQLRFLSYIVYFCTLEIKYGHRFIIRLAEYSQGSCPDNKSYF